MEDEVHFVAVCPVYQQLRDVMWDRVGGAAGLVGEGGDGGDEELESDEGQFAALLSSRQPAVIKAVARFVWHAWQLRQQQLGA